MQSRARVGLPTVGAARKRRGRRYPLWHDVRFMRCHAIVVGGTGVFSIREAWDGAKGVSLATRRQEDRSGA